MSKRLIIILALAFVVGIAFAAYAEVQNVKVSGDLTVKGVYRNDFDLAKSNDNIAVNTVTRRDKQQDLLSITRVRIDADLTDNVMTTVRLLNERNWNGDSIADIASSNRNIGLGATSTHHDEQQIDLDLAYVTMKEFLYSPLTLTVGRQELRFGNGWIVGDPDTNGIALRSALAEGDLSLRKAFDAIRATLNYEVMSNPLVIDMIYAKVAENSSILNDDTTLSGINANYKLDKNNTAEWFFFQKTRGSNSPAAINLDAGEAAGTAGTLAYSADHLFKQTADIVNTVGARLVNTALKNLMLDVQGAFQFGTYNPRFDPNARYIDALSKAETANRRAWGLELGGMFSLADIKRIEKYQPSIGGCYIYLSGENRDRTGRGDYHGWDSMFEDQTSGHILNAVMGFSNVQLGALSAQAKPMEDITAKLDYVAAWFNKRYERYRNTILSGVSGARQFTMNKNPFIGQEIDLTLTYDYTEDVQFSLLSGWFLPSSSINKGDNTQPQRASATEVIGSMKVTF